MPIQGKTELTERKKTNAGGESKSELATGVLSNPLCPRPLVPLISEVRNQLAG